MYDLIDVAAVLVSVSALFAYINHRFIGMPTTIGVMVVALLVSIGLNLISVLGFASWQAQATALLQGIDFNQTLMHGMLSFLLFAGALHVDVRALREQKWVVLCLATVGVCLSTVLVGTMAYYLLAVFSCHLPYIYCLLFGALISPTDPVAVMATVQRLGVSEEMEATIAGESLFNDGVGVVVFTVVLLLLQSNAELSLAHVGFIFLEEAVGGIVLGALVGALGFYLLDTVDDYKIEVLITFALVMGGYGVAMALHTSGPIAVVVAGLMIGNVLRKQHLSGKSQQTMHVFWQLVDEILNVILFALLGLEILILSFELQWAIAGVLLIGVVVVVRVISVGIPIALIRLKTKLSPHLVKILVWGGLRGGISVALALGLPDSEYRDLILFLTYVVVVFSIVVQGLTIGPFINRLEKVSE